MFVYVLVLLVLFANHLFSLAFKNKIIKTVFPLIISMIVLIVFCSLKSDNIGTDSKSYHLIFDKISAGDFYYTFHTNYDIGFSLFTKLFSIIVKSYRAYLFFVYLIIWFGFAFFAFVFAKEKANFCFALSSLFALQFALTALRQIMAVSFIAIAMSLYMIVQKKWLKIFLFLLFFLISVSFHSSAIICLIIPVCYLLTKRFDINIYLCLGVYISFMFGVRYIYYLIADFTNTVYSPFIRNSLPSTSIMAFAVFIIGWSLNCTRFSNQYKKEESNNNYAVNVDKRSLLARFACWFKQIVTKKADLNLIGDNYQKCFILMSLVAACTMSFSLITTIITRTYVFFETSLAFVITFTIANRKEKKTRQIAYATVVVLSLAYFCVSLLKSGFITNYVPYETWL